MDGLFFKEVMVDDSLKFLNIYVDKWVKEVFVLYEVELYILNDLNIDKLVCDYWVFLICNSYEEFLVEELLDFIIL